MPSISGLDDKISAVLECTRLAIDTQLRSPPSGNARVDTLIDARAQLGGIGLNRVQFENNTETREQAERRTINDALANIDHSGCSSCLELRQAL